MREFSVPVTLVGFPGFVADEVESVLAAAGCDVGRKAHGDGLQPNPGAVLVWAETVGWLQAICEIRDSHPRVPLVVVTRQPDYAKWLDALDAGAADYCCLPLDPPQMQWLFRAKMPASHPIARAAGAY